MYKVKGKTQTYVDEFEQEFETLEEAEKFIRKMAINYGVEAQIIEVSECCKYVYPFNRDRYRVLQLLDEHGIQYKLDKSLNITIEF